MFSALYNIIISPIELVLEVIFELMFKILGRGETNQGLAVIGVSLAVSLLALPLYHRADMVQQKARDVQQKMARWVNHIRKTFKGDERFLMLRTYYRINGYSPLSALNGSISLLLEIPFFIAAYHFLSHLDVLSRASFWIIRDLGKPDALLHIGAIFINILPILMTAINCVASAIYLKGFPIKDKVQIYGMAVIFLVLLYNSPAGLVIYWTCNNIFSLVKNIFYKLNHPRETAYILSAVIGTAVTIAVLSSDILTSTKKIIAILIFQCIAVLPLLCLVAKRYIWTAGKRAAVRLYADDSYSFVSFLLAGVLLTLLLGILIPSSVIASSASEFINLQEYRNPFLFLVNSTCYAAGFFLVWMGIIRHMLPQERRSALSLLLWMISCACLVNYMCFGRNLGTLSPLLVFDNGVSFSKGEKLINLLILCLLCGACAAVFKFKKLVLSLYVVLILCTGGVSAFQIYTGQKELDEMAYIKDAPQKIDESIIPLSRNGKNVIVFMLDRAISGYVPYLLEEKPFLKEQFDGFTYYPNAVSYGRHTNFGAPPIFGGYEYTPVGMNSRPDKLLSDKHNEALKMLPVLFGKNDYTVSVCDPPYAGYREIPDLSIFNDYPFIKAHRLSGVLRNKDIEKVLYEAPLERNRRSFFCYSIFKVLPPAVSKYFYDRGNYFSHVKNSLPKLFYEYSVLTLLPQITKIDNSKAGTFLSIQNATPHEPQLLKLPSYEMTGDDDSNYKTAAEGHIRMNRTSHKAHYHVNMATFLQLGKWFDYMRENGVYDNTRIILVADHGQYGLGQFDYMIMKHIYDKVFDTPFDVESVNPLLMVKDFNVKGFTVSGEFMTTADVPPLAVKDVIQNPINPFTGKEISDREKILHPQLITTSKKFKLNECKGTVFDTSDGDFLSVHDDIFKPENWELVSP